MTLPASPGGPHLPPRKTSLSSILACAALLVAAIATAFSILTWANHDIRFVRAEIAGLRALRPVAELLIQLPIYTLENSGQNEIPPAPAALAMDAIVKKIELATAHEQDLFRLTPLTLAQANRPEADPIRLRAQWEKLKSKPLNDSNNPDYAALRKSARALIAQIGDNSNLILDPDIDTFYLIDVILLTLPAHLERLSTLPPWRLPPAAAASSRHSPSEIATLIREVDLDRVTSAISAVQADDASHQRVPDPARHIHNLTTEAFQKSCTTLVDALMDGSADKDLGAHAAEAQRAAWNLWVDSADQLEHRLGLRLKNLLTRRAYSLAVAAFGFVICLLVVVKMFIQERDLRGQSTELNLARQTMEKDAQLRHAAEYRRHLIIDTALDGLVVINSDGDIIEWNTQAEQIFGWSRAEAIGRRLSEIVVPPAMRALHEAGLKRFLATGEGPVLGTRIEVTALRRDGQEFPIEITINPLKTDTGWEFASFLRDITDRKQTEADLIEAKDSAELASSRLQDIVSEVMILAEEAKAASNAKSEFLAVMSHELRTPMNGVIGMSELLLLSPQDPEQRTWTLALRSSGDALLTIINDVLDFSKIEAGKMEIEKLPFAPVAMANEVIAWLTPKAAEKKIRLRLATAKDLPATLIGDLTRCRQVLTNLAGNAVKFTTTGEVHLSLEWETNPAPQFCVRVTDTGIGIAPEKIGQLFQSFSQADSSTTRQYGGTGLGLAISKRLVELMGGQLTVESVVGHGSTFSFTLPLTAAAAPPVPVAPLPSVPFVPAPASANGPAVLLADDNEINILLGAEILHQLGCVVTVAHNGVQALARIQEKPFALVLMDCRMPEMDGYRATEEIRRREADCGAHRLPIVALTANAVEGDRKRCLDAGMDDYLPKPFHRQDLERVIRRWTNAAAAG